MCATNCKQIRRLAQLAMNTLQKQAVEAPNGYVQIVAGPGTGKTKTLVARIVELIRRGIDPSRICVLSFTRAAAREVKLRVAQELQDECHIVIGTFHSISYRFYRRYGNGKPLGIVDEIEKREIIGKLVLDSTQTKDAVRKISRIQVFGNTFDEETQGIYEQYTEIIRSMNKVDYDGLLSLFHELLEQTTKPQDSLDAVFVDEFQDASVLQLKIALLLASECQNLTVVGDPDQSIYSFRNAEPKTFQLMCSMAEHVERYYLESNYRSTQSILDAAHRVIMAAESRYASDRKLISECSNAKIPVRFCLFKSHALEAMSIAEQISKLVKSGVYPNEICVLSRQCAGYRNLESELMLRNIKVKVVGGRQIATSKEARAIVDYIRVALDNGDRLAISRTLNYPARKIGKQTVEKVSSGSANLPHMDLIRKFSCDSRFEQYIQIVDKITQVLGDEQDMASVEKVIEIISELVGAESSKVEELRLMLGQFASMIAEDHDPEEDRSFAQKFVSLLALGTDKMESDPQNSITLSTIHSAKGLEWPVVFLVGASEDPAWRSIETGNINADAEHEESRLLYVALTRAKHYLVISSPSENLNPKLVCHPEEENFDFDVSLDIDKLSQCLGRKLVAASLQSTRKTASTKLGKGIELGEGYVLASELPMKPNSLSTSKFRPNLVKPTKISKTPRKVQNNGTMLSFFRPAC